MPVMCSTCVMGLSFVMDRYGRCVLIPKRWTQLYQQQIKGQNVTQENLATVGTVQMTTKSNVFISLMLDYLPLFMVGFSICLLKGMAGLRAGYMGKTVLGLIMGLIIKSTVCAALAVGAAMLLPLLHIDPDPTTMLGVVVLVTVCGLQGFDAFIYKKLGIHLVDTTAYTEADTEWASLSEKERRDALEAYNKTLEEQSDGE